MQAYFLTCMSDKLQFRLTNLLVPKCIFNTVFMLGECKSPFLKIFIVSKSGLLTYSYHASLGIINHPLFPILMCYYIFWQSPCALRVVGWRLEHCLSLGRLLPHPDGVIPTMADGSKFFPSHSPSVGQNSGSFVASLICYETAK